MAAIGALLSLPYAVIAYPPLVDYPNHLARTFILERYTRTPSFQAAFERQWTVIPNLGIDLIVTPMVGVVGARAAGAAFLVLTTLIFLLGCHRLAVAVRGKPSLVALPCAFLILSSPFMYGFVNYMLGVGLFLLTLAAWLQFRRRRSGIRYVMVCVGVLACFVTHLSTLAFLAVTVGVVLAFDVAHRRRLSQVDVIDASVLIPAVMAFLAFRPEAGGRSPVEWNTVAGKAVALLAPIRSLDSRFDAVMSVLWGVLVVAAFRSRVAMRVHWPLLTASLLFFAGFVVTPKVLFTSSAADSRFVLPAILLLILSVEWTFTPRATRALLAAALALCVVRSTAIWRSWTRLSDETAALLALTDRLPVNAAVFSAQYERGHSPDTVRRDHSLDHVIHYATIRRGAIVSTLFTVPGVQPIVWRDRRPIEYLTAKNADRVLAGYGYVWTGHAPPDVQAALSARAWVIGAYDGYELWRLAAGAPSVRHAE